ncbi:hypothetical protein OF83DRAFT_1097476 [Amylostereum chailletii]|nr:hypothetical protein OF83DRAFT_1097476 [Amylostereum chailletii]
MAESKSNREHQRHFDVRTRSPLELGLRNAAAGGAWRLERSRATAYAAARVRHDKTQSVIKMGGVSTVSPSLASLRKFALAGPCGVYISPGGHGFVPRDAVRHWRGRAHGTSTRDATKLQRSK